MFRRIVPALLLAALAGLVGGCQPDAKAPVDVVVLVFNPTTKLYEPRVVQLHTVTDVVAMEGSVAKVIGGAEFIIDFDDPALAAAGEDLEKIREAITRDSGEPAKVSYIDTGGALVPADFHSLNIATSYYNIERSFDFFGRIGGLGPEQMGRRTLYYFPEYTDPSGIGEDNAAYISLLQSFFVFPFNSLQQIPLSINMGVVGHEFSHAVFNFRVQQGQPLPDALYSWTDDQDGGAAALNLLESLDEGIADVFGTGITCDGNYEGCNVEFFTQSLPRSAALARNVIGEYCMGGTTSQLYYDLTAMPSDTFRRGKQYEVGSVLASAIWRAGQDPALVNVAGSESEARRLVFEALYRAEGDPGLQRLVRQAISQPANFTLLGANGALAAIVQAPSTAPALPFSSTVQMALCRGFVDRFGISSADIGTACAGATGYEECN